MMNALCIMQTKKFAIYWAIEPKAKNLVYINWIPAGAIALCDYWCVYAFAVCSNLVLN